MVGTPQSTQETLGLNNGRFWELLPNDPGVRALYLAGIFDGWRLRGDEQDVAASSTLAVMAAGGTFTLGELVAFTNGVYAQPENLSLPVGWVLMTAFAVQRGEAAKEPLLTALRAHLAALFSRNRTPMPSEIRPTALILSFKKIR